MASGLVGVVLIQQPHLGGDRFAVLVALLSSVSTAVAMMGLHRLRGLDPRAIMAHFAGVASLVAGAWLLLPARRDGADDARRDDAPAAAGRRGDRAPRGSSSSPGPMPRGRRRRSP